MGFPDRSEEAKCCAEVDNRMSVMDIWKRRLRRRMRVMICGEPVLRRVADPITEVTDEIRELADRMITTMFENEVRGVGLAGPQVGVGQRIITLATHDPDEPVPGDASPGELLLGPRMPLALVNPEVLWTDSQTESSIEGCLSIPGISGMVERPGRIILRAMLLNGETLQVECAGLLGRCLLHEIDHLDGVLFIDRMKEEERAAIAPRVAALERRAQRDSGRASGRRAAGESVGS